VQKAFFVLLGLQLVFDGATIFERSFVWEVDMGTGLLLLLGAALLAGSKRKSAAVVTSNNATFFFRMVSLPVAVSP